jgi:hypothetical protein
MQQADTILPVSKASSVFDGVIRLFGRSRISTPQPDEAPSNIDWPDSDSDSIQPYHGSFKQPVSGGYNEAYIVQYWASYHLR